MGEGAESGSESPDEAYGEAIFIEDDRQTLPTIDEDSVLEIGKFRNFDLKIIYFLKL